MMWRGVAIAGEKEKHLNKIMTKSKDMSASDGKPGPHKDLRPNSRLIFAGDRRRKLRAIVNMLGN